MSNVSRKKYIPAESRVTRVLARTRPTMASPAASFDADAVAAYLLDRRHLLSAFELYQDLISPPATSTKAGERDVVRDGDADARAKLEAFFGDQKRFALSDVRAHADAVDGTPRQPSPPRAPNHRSSPPPDGATRRDLTLDPNLTLSLQQSLRFARRSGSRSPASSSPSTSEDARRRTSRGFARSARRARCPPRPSIKTTSGKTRTLKTHLPSSNASTKPRATTRAPSRTPRPTASSTAPSAWTWRT